MRGVVRLVIITYKLLALAGIAYGQAMPQLMPPEKEAALRACVPDIDNAELAAKIAEATLYTEDEMPRAMQSQSLSGGVGERVLHFESIYVRKNGNDDIGLPTNASRDFPWFRAGGTDRNHDVQRSFKGFWLPPKPGGGRWPVVWYRDYLQRSNAVNMPPALGYRWVFPKGTVFFEVLCMNFSDRYVYTWEVRVREREEDDWAVDVYRPFPTRESLVRRIAELRGENHWAVAELSKPVRLTRALLTDRNHPRRAFSEREAEYKLPPLESDLVRELLTTTVFKSALGEVFYQDGLAVAYAPTFPERSESIVPPGYLGGFIRTDRVGCMNCHQDTTLAADHFDGGRDWYANLSGGDNIFSWHPVELASVGRSNAARRPVVMRRAFTDAGILEKYDQQRHPKPTYKRSRHEERVRQPASVSRNRFIVGG